VQTHEVGKTGHSHASIRITPKDQDHWASNPRFQKGADGKVFTTLGAGPQPCLPQGACLVSDANRPTDAVPHSGNTGVDLGGRDENEVIGELIRADARYGDNLLYDPLPQTNGHGFNSNSYVSGVLRAAGLSVPAPVGVSLPGWAKPITINPLPF
jgi:hypothetical protein